MQTDWGGNTRRCPRWADPGHTELVKLGVPDSSLPSLGRRPQKPVTLLQELGAEARETMPPAGHWAGSASLHLAWGPGRPERSPLSPGGSHFSCFLGASLECPAGQCPGTQISPCDCQPVLVWCWAQPFTHQHQTARGQGEATPLELSLSLATDQLHNLGQVS